MYVCLCGGGSWRWREGVNTSMEKAVNLEREWLAVANTEAGNFCRDVFQSSWKPVVTGSGFGHAQLCLPC